MIVAEANVLAGHLLLGIGKTQLLDFLAEIDATSNYVERREFGVLK